MKTATSPSVKKYGIEGGATMSEENFTNLDSAIAKAEGEHAEALRWFKDHAGHTVSWQEIKDHADHGPRLVTQAKGIYKPHYTDFALSARQTLDSPYADMTEQWPRVRRFQAE
jgi:hypothetical protein